ncbi:phospholipase D-like domain-containing protein [Helicobacter marmotae]|uniref:phospholipase D n=1 Tax=Helicobacter marmotae TaxID=152490 RepID=A0A3D8I810_9HELI|nr:phospholipase D-like domain-containing protein [Helicobacter marmotae]RDU61155.1 DUF1669 domain-containing protein [Helicobacter marmotae]
MLQKTKKLLLACFALSLLYIPSLAKDTLYMLPYEQTQALNGLKNMLKNAQYEIKISIYSFTHNDIAKILRDSAKRGVRVYIIYDKESNMNNKSSTIGYLAKYNNISTCLLTGMRSANKKYFGIMHQKMAIVDEHSLAIGSANWTKNAFENNFETLLITDNDKLVNKALQAYEKMMHTCVGF